MAVVGGQICWLRGVHFLVTLQLLPHFNLLEKESGLQSRGEVKIKDCNRRICFTTAVRGSMQGKYREESIVVLFQREGFWIPKWMGVNFCVLKHSKHSFLAEVPSIVVEMYFFHLQGLQLRRKAQARRGWGSRGWGSPGKFTSSFWLPGEFYCFWTKVIELLHSFTAWIIGLGSASPEGISSVHGRIPARDQAYPCPPFPLFSTPQLLPPQRVVEVLEF